MHRVRRLRMPSVGLQRRITLYMAVGLAGLFGVFAYVALDSANRSSDVILDERVTLARLLASKIDSLLVAAGNAVDEAAEDAFTSELDGRTLDPKVAALASALDDLNQVPGARCQVPGGTSVGVFDGDGRLIAEHHGDQLSASSVELPPELPTTEYFVLHDPSGNAVISIARPISTESNDRGWVVAQFQPGSSTLQVAPETGTDTNQYRVELIASGGEVVASSQADERDLTSRHSHILSGLVEDQETRVVEHVPVDTGSDPVNHVVAFAPLSSGSLGIVLEQPEDVALALPNDLRRRILLISGIGLAIGLAVAWLTTRQVVRPLEILNRNARSITQGSLDNPITPSGQDEIRRLGESFESMRVRLSGSVSELERWSAELERRVLDRTSELEARNKERDMLLDKVITAQEDERTRVARELHDQVGQALTALVMQLGAAERLLQNDGSQGIGEIQRAREGLSETIDEVRRLMSDLRPSILDDMGLSSAVRWYAEQRLTEAGIQAEIAVDPVGCELSPATEISVFRVFQESINNSIKHAGAENVSVSLRVDSDQLEGTVADDGIGFDPQTVVPGTDGGWAVGLIGMRERVHLLNGKLDIKSTPGNGTKVSFQVPTKSEHLQ